MRASRPLTRIAHGGRSVVATPVVSVRMVSSAAPAQPQPSPFAAAPEVKKAVSPISNPTIGQGGQWRIVRTGGGRSSVSGITATVFGCTGFVGRYMVNVLGRRGSQVVIPYRGEGFNARHLKLSGDLGQIVPAPFSMYDKDSVLRTLARSNVAINLIGSNQKTKNFDLNDVNVKAAVRLATLAKEAGVERFIHVSALGASATAPSEYLRSKWEGEQAVLQVFPDATIIRPGPIFGPEDRYLNRLAKLVRFGGTGSVGIPMWGNEAKQWVQPIHVVDVAEAIFNSISKVETLGKTYDLGGLDVYEGREIMDLIIKEMYRDRFAVERPEWIGRIVASVLEKMPQFRWRVWTQDMLLTSRVDLVNDEKNLNGLKELDITEPRRLESHLSNLILKHRGMFGPRTQGMMVQEETNQYDNPLLIAHPDYNPAVSAAAREHRERK